MSEQRLEVRELPGTLGGIDTSPVIEVGDVLVYEHIGSHLNPGGQRASRLTLEVEEIRPDGSYVLLSNQGGRHVRTRQGNFVSGGLTPWQDIRVSPERDIIPHYPIVVGEVKPLRPFSFLWGGFPVTLTPAMDPPQAQDLEVNGQRYSTVRIRVRLAENTGVNHQETVWISPEFGLVRTEFISDYLSASYVRTLVQHCRRGVCRPSVPLS